MIVSRVALLLVLTATGYFAACGRYAISPEAPSPADSRDFVQVTSQSPASSSIPDRGTDGPARPAPHLPAPLNADLRLVAYESMTTTTAIRPEDPTPFQLISPEIRATTELIPGRWNARNRLLSNVFDQVGQEPERWISELQKPQLDWTARTKVAPREEAQSRRDRSERR